MRKIMWSGGLVAAMLVSGMATVSAQAPTVQMTNVQEAGMTAPVGNAEQSATPKVDIKPLLVRVAELKEYADWQNGQATHVRDLYDPTGNRTAMLWQVAQGDQQLGYLVTTADGTSVYEFSRLAVPTLPAELHDKLLDNSYIYAGPMLQLVYVQQAGQTDLYNLMTGETLPSGELLDRVPVLGANEDSMYDWKAGLERNKVKMSLAQEDDALYAVGVFGYDKTTSQQDALSLQTYAGKGIYGERAFVVYDAIPDKLYITLAICEVIEHGGLYYVGVQDPFTTDQDAPTVYIDSRFPVDAFPLQTSSAQ